MLLIKERGIRFTPVIVIIALLAGGPLFIGTALVSLMTKILIFALMAMSLDIAFGYAGLWSFGHAALFGVAAYTNGILIKHYSITSFWLAAPSGVFMAMVASAIFGLIALRMSGLYFLLITFALGQLIYSIALKWIRMTGGSDGLRGIPYPNLGFSFSPISFYYFTLAVLGICAVALYFVTRSPFGYGLQGIRENETRMRVLGYNVWLHKYIAFISSGLFGGVAGVLYIHFNGLITPASVGMTASGLAIIMIIIGGRGTLWGAMIGSGVIFLLEYYVSMFTPERWPAILGACFIAAVMLTRGGILPKLMNLWRKLNPHGRTEG
jgi:branched-chain amino acid transport system permease protein